MKEPTKVSERISVGGQPDAQDLEQLAQSGFRSVVNLRTPGEANQPLSPESEATQAESAGLAYRNIPVSVSNLTAAQVNEFRKAVEQLPGPVYVHCAAGGRALAFALMSERPGATAEDVLAEADEKGTKLREGPLQGLIDEYLGKKG